MSIDIDIRFKGDISPLRSLMTPGTRTKSTLERKSKLADMGEPEELAPKLGGIRSTKECAIARHRRRCPSPKHRAINKHPLMMTANRPSGPPLVLTVLEDYCTRDPAAE